MKWLFKFVKDWLRGLGIVIIVMVVWQIATDPTIKFLNRLVDSPLVKWIPPHYQWLIVLTMTFIALPIFLSRVAPRIALFLQRIWGKHRGWKPGMIRTDDGKGWWPVIITGKKKMVDEDEGIEIGYSLYKVTVPAGFTGLAGIYPPEYIWVVTNITLGAWMADALFYFSNQQPSDSIRKKRFDRYLDQQNRRAPSE